MGGVGDVRIVTVGRGNVDGGLADLRERAQLGGSSAEPPPGRGLQSPSRSYAAASCEPLNIARNVPTEFADGASQPSRQEIIANEPRQRGRGSFRADR